jgi:hypothetical protein
MYYNALESIPKVKWNNAALQTVRQYNVEQMPRPTPKRGNRPKARRTGRTPNHASAAAQARLAAQHGSRGPMNKALKSAENLIKAIKQNNENNKMIMKMLGAHGARLVFGAR